MGQFLNPDDSAFRRAANSEIYIDKTGLIEYTNRVSNTLQSFICNSRPRRFGKSVTADMLTAYYSRGCDSRDLFSRYSISRSESFNRFLNRCNVIHLDIQWFMTNLGDPDSVISSVTECVIKELKQTFTSVSLDTASSISFALSRINAETGEKFVIIIDEWDVLLREPNVSRKTQTQYIDFLRSIFKGSEPSRYIQLAYLTGILPIIRQKTQSPLNNFDEYTMLDAGELAPYIGFTEEEVKTLCQQYSVDYEKVRAWYDGYLLNGISLYNPRAVVSVMLRKQFRSYWSVTGTYTSISGYINMNFDGLKEAIISMLSGSATAVDVNSFQNDPNRIENRDDVLTLLIHLGYLAYDETTQTAYIPNEEIRQEFLRAVKSGKWTDFETFEFQSQELLQATLDQDEPLVAEKIEQLHQQYIPVLQYNNENSLASVITLAYLSTLQYYFRPVREMPTGRGFADIVYIPKPEYKLDYPALVIELKWNKDADTALQQIQRQQYPEALLPYTDDILLVGINYDKRSKKHECRISALTEK